MSANSAIEWTDRTWNPTTGCDKVSPGCANCYAVRDARRLSGNPNAKVAAAAGGTTVRHANGKLDWSGLVNLHEDRLLQPLSWGAPQRVFVNSMSDLFHEDVPDAFIDKVFAVMAHASRHTFQILTKRALRMREYFAADRAELQDRWDAASDEWTHGTVPEAFPLPNVWLGVSVEDRPRRQRIDDLRRTPAAVRFVSFEPLLEDVSAGLDLSGIRWTIWGGESGAGARPCALEWLERGVKKSRAYLAAPFVKQLGAYVVSEERTFDQEMVDLLKPRIAKLMVKAPNGEYWAWRAGTEDRKGGEPSEWPEHLQVREFPEAIR